MTRICSDCPREISAQSKHGRCRSCALRKLNADPAFQARRVARLAAAMSRPGVKERHLAGCKRGAAKRMADPIQAERLRELGRTIGKHNIHHAMTPEARAKCGEAVRAKHLAWCPPEFWPLNQKLKRSGYRLDDRKRMIAGEVQRVERDRLAAMTPFERQMERLRNGAKLIEVRPLRRADPAYTMGGVAPEAM